MSTGRSIQVGDQVTPTEGAREPAWLGKIGTVVGVDIGSPADPFVAVKFQGQRKPVAFYPRHLMVQERMDYAWPFTPQAKPPTPPTLTRAEVDALLLGAVAKTVEQQGEDITKLLSMQAAQSEVNKQLWQDYGRCQAALTDLRGVLHDLTRVLIAYVDAKPITRIERMPFAAQIADLHARTCQDAPRTQNKAPQSDESDEKAPESDWGCLRN